MKTLYLIHHAGSGGAEGYVERLCRHAPERCGLCYGIPGPLSQRLSHLPRHRIAIANPFDLRAARAIARLCRREGYTVIHAQFPRENCVALLSRLFGSGARVVYTAHLTDTQPWHWRVLNRLFTPHNHRIIAVCQASAQALRRNSACPGRITVIPNGIDPDSIPPRDRRVLRSLGIPDGIPVIMSLARFSPEKGLDVLCEAAGLLKTRSIPFRMILAGDGPELAPLRQRVQDLDLTDTVLLPGYRGDSGALLAASDIYVNSSRREAMSFALLEAMAAGKPTVATAVGGTPELLDEACGILIPPDDPHALAQALEWLLADPQTAHTLGQAARHRVTTQFHQTHLLRQVWNTYQ